VAIETSAPRTRRSILAGALGGLGILGVSALGRASTVAAANDDNVLLGQGSTDETQNAATLPTVINSTSDALGGNSTAGVGVAGRSTGPGDPESGHSTGVMGVAGDGSSIAPTTNEVGVYGFSNESTGSAGIWGDSLDGTGIVGTGYTGVVGVGLFGVYGLADLNTTGGTGIAGDSYTDSTGVLGFSGEEQIPSPIPGVGVVGMAGTGASTGVRGHALAGSTYGVVASAASTSQVALYVSGKLKLSRSGRVSTTSSATSKKVTMAGVTTSSYIVATLQTSVSGCYVRAVVPASGSFTIYLSKAPGKTAYIGYVVVN
jgi:hypothetical protein